MNKNDLIEAVASEMKATKQDAAKAVEAVLACITLGVKNDSKVNLVGFGTFVKKERGPRIMADPRTRKPINVPPSKTCGFRPSSILKGTI